MAGTFSVLGNGANSPAGIFELRRDTGANAIDLTAGGLVTTFTLPSLAGANSIRDFFPTIGVTLDPNSKYWFMTGVTNSGTFEWDYANTGLFTGPGSLGEFGDSIDSGVTWSYHDSPFFPYFLQVNGSGANVPEPTAGVFLAVCVGIAFSGSRRRRRFPWSGERIDRFTCSGFRFLQYCTDWKPLFPPQPEPSSGANTA